MSFQEVEDNANRQYADCKELASEEISDFYPELHTEPVGGVFSNSLGSHLLADILTSHHVLVDLYDFADESALIKQYGVDKKCLLALRDAGHITICCNVQPRFLPQTEWLHDVLADPRTIFRAVRTPLCFQRRLPDLAARQKALEGDLLATLPKTDAEVRRLGELANPSRPYQSREVIAEVLAIWATRLRAVIGYRAEDIIGSLQVDPEAAILPLRQHDLWAVTPESAGLGGVVRIPYKLLRTYFPEVRQDTYELQERYVRLEALNSYLTRTILGAPDSDLSSEEYWHRLDEYDRDRLLDHLSDRRTRLDAARAENTIRLELAGSDPKTWGERDIERLADHLAEQGRRYERAIHMFGSVAINGYVHHQVEAWTHEKAPRWLVELSIISHEVMGMSMREGKLRPFVEAFSPKIHIAHFVDRYRR